MEELRAKYVIARNDDNERVVLYPAQSCALDDRFVVKGFSRIESLHNTGLFAFDTFMESHHIGWSGKDAVLMQEGSSLKAGISRFLLSQKGGALYGWLFYGISMEEGGELFSSFGLPLIGLVSLMNALFRKVLEPKHSRCASCFLCGILMILFGWRITLFRMLVFSVVSLYVENRMRRWSLQVLIMLMLVPESANAITLIFPALMQMTELFSKRGLEKKVSSFLSSIILQILLFSKISLVSLMAFRPIRLLLGLFTITSLFLLPFENGQIWLLELVQGLQSKTLPLTWIGYCILPIAILLSLALFGLCLYPGWKTKKMAAVSILVYLLSFSCDPFFHVYSLSIGQGDCTLIVEPFQKSAVMIDAAGHFSRDNAARIIIPFLESRRIRKLDALIVTHDDFDHSGAVDSLCANFPVESVITERSEVPDVDYPFYSLLEEREGVDENDASFVSLFSYDAFSYLWMGDASKAIEQQLITKYAISADVLKLGHHGSKTSSDLGFLETVNARLGIVSAEKDNRYGHPHLETLINAQNAGLDLLQTQENGMIHMQSFRHLMLISCTDGTFSMFWKF